MTTLQRVAARRSFQFVAVVIAMLVAAGYAMWPAHAQVNLIVQENALTGSPASEWDVAPSATPGIEGFTTDISVNKGDTVNFKINSANAYSIDIYRLGYYGGLGARKVTVSPISKPAQVQPACASDATTGLTDCGNWAVSASFSTAGLTSGIYIAKLTAGTGAANHIAFVVRDDARRADIVVQTSDTTWQAYNRYGIGSLYCAPAGNGPLSNVGTAYENSGCLTRSAKVSYNRPFDTRSHDPQSWLFNAEYPMVRFLEANGYDIKYISGVDTERRAADLVGTLKPAVFLSSGHDEYWSAGQRASVEAARNNGVSLAFFSGNEMFWKTRFEASIDGTSTAFRTLVSYKDTLAGAKIDPLAGVTTGTWRDTRFAPPVADGGRPENAVTGTFWTVNSGTSAITVPASLSGMRFWRNTSVANVGGTLADGSLGYEWDEDLDNGSRPGGLIHLSSTTVSGVEKIIDFGAHTGTGTATHSLTLYRHASGALVFGAGTVQWAWGLDGNHDRGASTPNQSMQQATVNLLADMGVQPASVQNGANNTLLITSAASLDHTAPTSVVTGPTVAVGSGSRVTVTGTASDSGGGSVAAVEVSFDNGASWHTAQGTTAWTYQWQPGAVGTVVVKSRGIDDSGNVETPSAGLSVAVNAGVCPCPNLFPAASVPTTASVDDPNPVELGLKFRSDVGGTVTGVRFYRGANNLGTHIGNLWTVNGTLLATAQFVEGDSVPGWQQVLFSTPVGISPNTTYVVSYHSGGNYAADGAYFATAGVDASPLHADPTTIAGGNGVFQYGPVGFPTQTFNATNYWVDVVFSTTADQTAPVISGITATVVDSATATITWSTNEPASSRIDYSTDSAIATNVQTAQVPGFVTAHSVRLTGLLPSTHYYYKVTSADSSGNTASAQPPTPTAPPGQPPILPGFGTPAPMVHDTTSADFNAGTLTNTYVAENLTEGIDGKVTLAPAAATEFSGPAMPAGWPVHVWTPGGGAVISGGRAFVRGARVAECDIAETGSDGACADQFGPGRSVEFVATFAGDPYQHSGLGQTMNSTTEPFALISTVWYDALGVFHSGNKLAARSFTGSGAEMNTVLGTTGTELLNQPHRFRIDWQASQINYYVDDMLLASHAITVAGPMRPVAASDIASMSGNVVVDFMRMTPYAPSGSFLSRVLDGTTTVDWNNMTWISVSDNLKMYVRGGSTATPDSTWTAFAPVAAPGAITLHSRYVQYRADMSTIDPNVSPELHDVVISGAASSTPPTPPPPVAPIVSFTGAPATAPFASTFTVVATTNASTPAVITASGACSIAGTLVTMTSGTGACSLTASWAADSTYLAATATQSTTATKIDPTTTTVVSSAAATTYGQLVSLTGSVSSPKGSPTGTMTYNDVLTFNGVTSPTVVIGTAAVNGPSAIYSTFALAGGTHSITAAYSGDSNFNSKSSSLVIVTVTPVGIASLNPTSVNFSSQPIGVPSMAIPVMMTNIGDANLAIAGVQVSGDNPTDFQTSGNTCTGANLIPGASCLINVKFNPNATGTRTASLIFTDNSNGLIGSVQPISLVGSSMSNSSANFTAKPIAGGKTLWFASELAWAKGPHDLLNVFMDMSNHPVRIFVTNGVIKFTANATNYAIPVPDALITFSPLVTSATTTFDTVNNRWVTTVPTVQPFSKLKQFDIEIGRIFASGVAFTVPAAGLPGGIKNVTWSAAYSTDTPGMDLRWRWGAAVYSTFSSDYNALTVKPTDPVRAPWAKMTNNDQAGTPEAFKQYFNVSGGGTADDADDFTGDLTPNVGVLPDVAQANIAPIPVVFPGIQAAGTTTAPVIATITNNHQTLSLIVSSLGVSGIDFTLVSAGTMPCSLTGATTLAGGGSCTVGVVFAPKDMGTRTGSVNIGFSTPPGIAADEAPKPFKLDVVGVAK